MKKHKVAIIGFGKMGKIRERFIKKRSDTEIVCVSEPIDKDELDGYPNREINDIIQDKDIDTVFICTPNYLNKELTIQSLENGKNVFCEKPPAFNSYDMYHIMQVEREHPNQKLMYGFNHRHHDSIKLAKEMIDSGQYGKLLWMRGRYGKSVDKNFFNNWRAKKELAGGGILLDQGIHMLDLMLMFAEDFDDVHAFVSNLYWKLEIEDNVFAIFRNTKSGVVASLHSTMTQWRHLFSFELFLEKGYIVINGLLTSSRTYGREILTYAKNRSTAPAATWSDEEKVEFTVDNSWENEINLFFDAINNKNNVSIGNSEQAFKLMKLIDRIYLNQ